MNCFRRFVRESDDSLSSLYREGVKATQEGRYVISESIYHRIIHSHPSYKFWLNVHNSVRQTNLTGVCDTASRESDNSAKDEANGSHKLIKLSFDNHVIQVIDFIRLCMDIAHIHIKEPANEMSGRLAMTYYALVITSLLEFLHLMMLWGEEVGEGLMSQDKSTNNSGEKLLATPLDIMISFRCLKHIVIFYLVSATVNYIVLSLQYIYYLDGPKNKLKLRILNNCLELGNLIHLSVKWTVRAMPESTIRQFLLQHMSSMQFIPCEEEETDDEKNTDGKSDTFSFRIGAQSVNESWGGLVDTIFEDKGFGSFFLIAKKINPAMRLVQELPKNPCVRLHIATKIPKHQLACIEPPTQRNSFHYISWFFSEYVSIIPGHNGHYLAQELPDLFGPDGKSPLQHVIGDVVDQHTSLKIKPKTCDSSVVFFKSDNAIRPLSAFEMSQNMHKRKNRPRTADSLRRHLNLSDLRVLAVVGLEELMLLGAPMLVITSSLLTKMGRHQRALEFLKMVEKMSELIYGVNSPEYDFLVSLHDLCTVKL